MFLTTLQVELVDKDTWQATRYRYHGPGRIQDRLCKRPRLDADCRVAVQERGRTGGSDTRLSDSQQGVREVRMAKCSLRQ